MSNFVKHYNDPDLYYDLERISEFRIDWGALTITLSHLTGQLAVETFADALAQETRLRALLDLSSTSGSEYPA